MGIDMISVSKEVLTDYGCRVLEAAGVPKDEAAFVTECLVNNDMKGYITHGVGARIPWYIPGFKEGRTYPFGKTGVKIKILRETPAVTIVDGCGGIGFTVAKQAMDLTIEKAKKVGMATTGCHNLGHIGRVGMWAEMALEHDMIGVAVQGVNGTFTTPWGGIEGKLPPSPTSIAIPTGHGSPFVMDMCMAPSSGGKMYSLIQSGEEAPAGWLIDKEGNPTQDPKVFFGGGGAMLPLGQEGLGYKGYALAMVLSVLSGPLIGAYDFESHRPMSSAFLGAIDIAAFTPIDEFKRSMDDMVADIKSSKLAKGFKEILIPGEGARAREKQALKSGVLYYDWAWQMMMETAKELEVDTSVYKFEDGGALVSFKL